MTRRAPLELAFVPRGVEEPLLGYYSVTPLTPGGWADLLGDVGLPDTLRRLSQTVAVGDSHRTVEMRCLEMLPAMAHLLTERDGPSSASVRAWRLAARVVEQSVLAGGDVPDLGRFAAAFPAAGHAVLIRDEEGEARTEAATDAIAGFVDAASRALSAAVRDPRIMRAPEAHADIVDLGMLQPLLRAVAPDLGLAPPLVRLHGHARAASPAARSGSGLGRRLAASRRSRRPGDPAQGGSDLRAARTRRRRPRDAGPAGGRRAAPGRLGARVRRSGRGAPARAGRGAGPRARRRYLEFAPGALSLGGVVRYDLRASLGGREISAEEFQALAAATQPLVRIGGEWRALKGRALARAKALAAIALHGSSMPAMTALGAALAGRYEVRGLAVEVGDPSGGARAAGRPPARAGAGRAGRAARRLPGRAPPVPEGRPGMARRRPASSGWARSWPTTWASERRSR